MLYQDGYGGWELYTGGLPKPTTAPPSVESPCQLISVGDSGSVDVNVHGYQLFDVDRLVETTVSMGGMTVTNNGDGSVSFRGTPTSSTGVYYALTRDETLKLIKAGKLKISVDAPEKSNPYVYFRLTKAGASSSERFEVSTSHTVPSREKEIPQELLDNPEYYAMFGIYVNKDKAINVDTVKIMIHQDGDGTWEPFKPIQTLTIPSPNGLPGVPVSAGGNYTDASGQQWVCDEKDYDRDVYVTRTTKLVINGNEDWKTWGVNNKAEGITAFYTYVAPTIPLSTANTSIICSHLPAVGGVYGGAAVGCGVFASATKPYVGVSVPNDCLEDVSSNEAAIASFKRLLSESNMTVIYPKIPEETRLSEEEIAAYKALHTHCPNTSIHNSDNAHMAVDYVADTKNYVDNQIKKEVAELTAAILTQ